MAPLTTDMNDLDARPYFLWDRDVTVRALREAMNGPDGWEKDRLLGTMLREARDIDVWAFVTPEQVARALPRVRRRVGRRAAFWEWLLDGWRKDGLLDAG